MRRGLDIAHEAEYLYAQNMSGAIAHKAANIVQTIYYLCHLERYETAEAKLSELRRLVIQSAQAA